MSVNRKHRQFNGGNSFRNTIHGGLFPLQPLHTQEILRYKDCYIQRVSGGWQIFNIRRQSIGFTRCIKLAKDCIDTFHVDKDLLNSLAFGMEQKDVKSRRHS